MPQVFQNPKRLVEEFKKSGEFDRLRRQLLTHFANSDEVRPLMSRVEEIAREKLLSDERLEHKPREAVHSELMQDMERYPIVERAVSELAVLKDEALLASIDQYVRNIVRGESNDNTKLWDAQPGRSKREDPGGEDNDESSEYSEDDEPGDEELLIITPAGPQIESSTGGQTTPEEAKRSSAAPPPPNIHHDPQSSGAGAFSDTPRLEQDARPILPRTNSVSYDSPVPPPAPSGYSASSTSEVLVNPTPSEPQLYSKRAEAKQDVPVEQGARQATTPLDQTNTEQYSHMVDPPGPPPASSGHSASSNSEVLVNTTRNEPQLYSKQAEAKQGVPVERGTQQTTTPLDQTRTEHDSYMSLPDRRTTVEQPPSTMDEMGDHTEALRLAMSRSTP